MNSVFKKVGLGVALAATALTTAAPADAIPKPATAPAFSFRSRISFSRVYVKN